MIKSNKNCISDENINTIQDSITFNARLEIGEFSSLIFNGKPMSRDALFSISTIVDELNIESDIVVVDDKKSFKLNTNPDYNKLLNEILKDKDLYTKLTVLAITNTDKMTQYILYNILDIKDDKKVSNQMLKLIYISLDLTSDYVTFEMILTSMIITHSIKYNNENIGLLLNIFNIIGSTKLIEYTMMHIYEEDIKQLFADTFVLKLSQNITDNNRLIFDALTNSVEPQLIKSFNNHNNKLFLFNNLFYKIIKSEDIIELYKSPIYESDKEIAILILTENFNFDIPELYNNFGDEICKYFYDYDKLRECYDIGIKPKEIIYNIIANEKCIIEYCYGNLVEMDPDGTILKETLIDLSQDCKLNNDIIFKLIYLQSILDLKTTYIGINQSLISDVEINSDEFNINILFIPIYLIHNKMILTPYGTMNSIQYSELIGANKLLYEYVSDHNVTQSIYDAHCRFLQTVKYMENYIK